jgi:hypothetical protein
MKGALANHRPHSIRIAGLSSSESTKAAIHRRGAEYAEEAQESWKLDTTHWVMMVCFNSSFDFLRVLCVLREVLLQA